MRKKIVAGNWKMNNDLAMCQNLLTDLKNQYHSSEAEIMVAPSFTNLWQAFETLREYEVEVIAQNMHQEDKGAFTGEISAEMLKSIGVKTVILGHSERRAHFHETDEILAQKVNSALRHDMQVIFCIGEELDDRKKGNQNEVVGSQIKNGLFHLSQEQFNNIILAYEPVWAIGTGETATPEQAQEMHKYIRGLIREKYGEETAENTSILYGGSVKPDNAKEIFSKPDVDGGLVGGASLNAKDFFEIVNSI